MGVVVHGHSPAGPRSPTYNSWASMKKRCGWPRDPNYGLYGGRGITVCAAWQSFAGFLADMGPRPIGTTLDRIDPNRGYEPGNCRWATPDVQARNKRPRAKAATCSKGHPTPPGARYEDGQCVACAKVRRHARYLANGT